MPLKNRRTASHFGFTGDYELPPFWIVTRPSPNSEMADILFESDLFGFILQEKGGLKGSEIVGFYTSQSKAKKIAEKLLAQTSEGNKYEKILEAYHKSINEK